MEKADLVFKGYKEYKNGISPYANRLYQRRIMNDKGDTLYFINVDEFLSDGKMFKEDKYEANIQFYRGDKSMNIKYFGEWSIKAIENEARKLFKSLNIDIYESNEI